mmetsp:Transcript_26585/g.72945  ORF Transcript_26585/g.72945 Transcript_26585/m.72945 type:complete len:229 (-) Transcript_26585:175-861(-)|eukprot:scaffold147283_cov32-Tisochrysis_lutea.AAC.1
MNAAGVGARDCIRALCAEDIVPVPRFSQFSHSASRVGAYFEQSASGACAGRDPKPSMPFCRPFGAAASLWPYTVWLADALPSPSVAARASFKRSNDQAFSGGTLSSDQLRMRMSQEASWSVSAIELAASPASESLRELSELLSPLPCVSKRCSPLPSALDDAHRVSCLPALAPWKAFKISADENARTSPLKSSAWCVCGACGPVLGVSSLGVSSLAPLRLDTLEVGGM